MGLFDNLVGDLEGLAGGQGGGASGLLSQALSSVGGYQGVLTQLEQSGMGAHVQSWLSDNAANLPISADQLRAALGNEQLQQMAAKMGIPVDQVAGLLAQHLPAAVDQASSGGTLQAGS